MLAKIPCTTNLGERSRAPSPLNTRAPLIWWVRQYVIMCFIDSCTYRDSELISDYLLSFFKLFAWIYMYKHKNTFTCFVSCKLHNVVSFNIYLTFSILYLFAPEVSHMYNICPVNKQCKDWLNKPRECTCTMYQHIKQGFV